MRDLPRLYNGMLLPAPQVEKLGFKIQIAGGTIGVIFKAIKDSMEELKRTGTVATAHLTGRDDVTNLLGLPAIYEMERRYGISDITPAATAAPTRR